MTTIILRTNSDNEDYNGDCDFAVIDLTPELATQALARVKTLQTLQQKDNQLYKIYYWDGQAEFFSWYEGLEELVDSESEDLFADALDRGYFTAHERPAIPEKVFQRTECNQIIIKRDGVAWVVIPKHTNIYVTTHEIPVSLLKEAQTKRGNPQKKQHTSAAKKQS